MIPQNETTRCDHDGLTSLTRLFLATDLYANKMSKAFHVQFLPSKIFGRELLCCLLHTYFTYVFKIFIDSHIWLIVLNT